MSPSLPTITAMKTLAVIAAVMIAVLSGCSTSRSDYMEWKYRGMPTKAAYNDYQDAESRAESALNHAKFGVKASNQAPNITNKIRLAYGVAWSAAHAYCTNRSPFPKDTARLRATRSC